MTRLKLSALFVSLFSILMLTGCADDLRIQNERQRKEIAELGGKLQTNKHLRTELSAGTCVSSKIHWI